LSPELEAALRPVVERVMQAGQVPGIALALAVGDDKPERLVLGTDAAGRALEEGRLFAVASISKLAVGLVVLRLVESGRLGLDEPIGQRLPDAAAAREGVTVRMLLAHTSGMPYPLLEEVPPDGKLDWHVMARVALETPLEAPLEAPPLTRVQYSNPGYGLLGVLVERCTGMTFGQVLDEEVLRPLGIEGYLGIEPPRRVAKQADIRGPNAGTEWERFNSVAWLKLGLPWGGLVTTLDGALQLIRAYRGHSSGYLRPETLAEATRDQTGGLAGGQIPPLMWPRCPWGLGPELRGDKVPHWAPTEASPESFGHAGASGCLAWADPAADVAWVFIGTRTADNGWLVRHGRGLGSAILAAVE
jgi:CubicO group peptidase (beta-lactamase class C family)